MAIPVTAQAFHHVGDVDEKIGMSIDAEDFPFLAEMLNSLYSNTILAILREYATNAWDSHVDAGVTRPIEITLPTESDLHLTVRDYGLGLSVDDIRTVFSKYGASTKRGSNAVAGQLGMGSKSALSYADMFVITAVKGGVKVRAIQTKDENGVGEIQIKDTVGTDEPNGVQIKVPVGRWDIDRFADEAENLFQFWEPGTVLIDGKAPAEPDWKASALPLDDDTLLVRPDAGLYNSYVIMGNVPYPVDDVSVGRTSVRFVARLNIGDVHFVPSREAVKHTPHTDATLASLREYVKATFDRAIGKALGSVSSRWDEAMLKVLWMDRGLRLDSVAERPIWHYEPHGWGRKSRSHFRYNLRDLAQPRLTVITGFTAKNISTVARDKLDTFMSDKGVTKPVYIIIPDNIASGVFEGRPNTYDWATIVGETKAVKGAKVKREKYETIYTTVAGPGMTGAELAEVTGKVLYLNPGESAHKGTLDATVVALYSPKQLARVKRFVPTIESYNTEVLNRMEAAKKAVTAQDKRLMQSRTLPTYFTKLDPDAVSDPELATMIRLAKTDDTDTLRAAKTFNVLPQVASVADKFNERYPLLNVGYYGSRFHDMADDVTFYVNAKYDAVTQLVLDTRAS
jgi:hypothetical protein